MDPIIIFIAALSAYLLGAISFSRLITGIIAPDADIEDVKITSSSGSTTEIRTIGANTASMIIGPRYGCMIGWLDILKVTIPTLAFRLLFPDQPYFLIAAIFGMVGHNYPIYYKFKGGGGISPLYGGFIAIDWLGALVCALGGLILGLGILKNVLIAFMSGAWLMIPWFWFRTHDPIYVAYAVIVNMLLIIALLPEIKHSIEKRKEGEQDVRASLQTIPMGRAMLKIMELLRFSK